MGRALLSLTIFWQIFAILYALRDFRSWSERTYCENSIEPNFPFVYQKYGTQLVESKGRVNSNLQDFRHECQVKGGRSKCHICEDIDCASDQGVCHLQLQGVSTADMSQNIPAVTDDAWAVGGAHRHDFGGAHVTHFCVFLSRGTCVLPSTSNFDTCPVRCFGFGFSHPPSVLGVNTRSVIDRYIPKRWTDDNEVDLWSFPRNCSGRLAFQGTSCNYTNSVGSVRRTPDFNPQGFTFTLAGSGASGFTNGQGTAATFNGPQDVAVDDHMNLYVADTLNNAIRKINPAGLVSTVAGKGKDHVGFANGLCSQATFSEPTSLDVRIDSSGNTLIVVADTGNHRIRMITIDATSTHCTVRCFSGLCGNNTNSESLLTKQATPNSGYADGSGLEARFSAPKGVMFMPTGEVVVADTGNYLIRWITTNGTTSTLAGTIVPGEKNPNGNPLAGCPPPCLAGQQGFRDGNLTYAQFFNPVDVTIGTNGTVWVVDEHRIRIIELQAVVTHIYGVMSEGRVSTIAGTGLQGREDGINNEATFFEPYSVFVTGDNIAHVVDSASCRVRRITPMTMVSEQITCYATLPDVFRPSGCTSFDQNIDKIGRKVSRVEANIQYNYGWPYQQSLDQGKYIKNCVGTPPQDTLDKHFISQGDNLVIDDHVRTVNEFGEQGTVITVSCPPGCLDLGGPIYGHSWYSEYSSICVAAIHDGKLSNAGGLIQIMVQRTDYLTSLNASRYRKGSVGGRLITSTDYPSATSRIYNIELFYPPMSMVHTVGGRASAPLESGCGFADAQPANMAMFSQPRGITAKYGSSASDTSFLYIADMGNNRIRAISAVCTQICENGGRCVGHDTCQCKLGWNGIDCTKPACASCPANAVCTSPNKCTCKPGFTGSTCSTPQCLQTCHNGGVCSSPDTCTCAPGWFDSNCTTPVCSQTCANGGNCTAANKCACPAEWGGPDCRVPKCQQTCHNGGRCMAPNTCSCPPQYINYDCSVPVCHQGYFQANPGDPFTRHLYAKHEIAVPTYKNCDIQSWCNMTNEFECDQQEYSYGVIQVGFGPVYRNVTGRKTAPSQCMNIELPTNYKIPFDLLYADGTKTGYMRYSPNSPYTSYDANPWRGYLEPTENHTGPWTYTPDRQLANVNWLNVSQGVYVCANGGNCTEPDICECAPGWIGFDCRTPVCTQGYYHEDQTKYVSGLEIPLEVQYFERFMGPQKLRLQWPYSNPSFSTQWELYLNDSYVKRLYYQYGDARYNGPSDWSSGQHGYGYQGGYRCSVRAMTKFENREYIESHPNYYSRYMDTVIQKDGKVYANWTHMFWPPVHQKSRILDVTIGNTTYVYTNEGFRRWGIWNRTDNTWQYGTCIMEFKRNCTLKSKELDMASGLFSVLVQDTDLSYRMRLLYDDYRVTGPGRWNQGAGTCIDEVIRGCFNNGTCVAPNTCKCAPGWRGSDCSVPYCPQTCFHHGNCTGPSQCICEKGWSGYDCSIPICAQECMNQGVCVAPDTCQCNQWPNFFRDGRVAGGRPLYQDKYGSPLYTGWTGYDCSVPICVQAQYFYVNIPIAQLAFPDMNVPVDWVGTRQAAAGTTPTSIIPGFTRLGGHGAAATLECKDSSGRDLPRCPNYDLLVTGNSGVSFQVGCGYDPYDTGCCIPQIDPNDPTSDNIICYTCAGEMKISTDHTFYCSGEYTTLEGSMKLAQSKFSSFLDFKGNFRICGAYHSPRTHDVNAANSKGQQDYGTAEYYHNPSPFYAETRFSSFNMLSKSTSNRFLCHVDSWTQGDYHDGAGLESVQGVDSTYGLFKGRHQRINFANMIPQSDQSWIQGPIIPGEGIYACYNDGSCLGPDSCTCTDGYEGFDCSTPQCRHLQNSGAVSSCLNGGICVSKDTCVCVNASSVLYKAHPSATRGITGWSGSDCSIPICVQGFFDPFCTDLEQAPAGEGCFRCSNGGNCTAPDVCTCAPGWTGYDCKTPVCEVVADPLTRTQLGVVYESKVVAFESDPCGLTEIYGMRGFKGTKYARGNCSEPNLCTCLCKVPYSLKACTKTGHMCDGPWQDPMYKLRDVLAIRGTEYEFGSTDCAFGYEGNVDLLDRFTTCHQTIYVPSSSEKDSVVLIAVLSVLGSIAIGVYAYINDRVKQRYLLAKIEKRRSKRSSEESLTKANAGAFVNK